MTWDTIIRHAVEPHRELDLAYSFHHGIRCVLPRAEMRAWWVRWGGVPETFEEEE